MDESTAQVWKLSAMDMGDDDIDLVDDDELLDEDDLKKPDPSSLRGCGFHENIILSSSCLNYIPGAKNGLALGSHGELL